MSKLTCASQCVFAVALGVWVLAVPYATAGTESVGVPHPNNQYFDFASIHDPSSGPLVGADFSFNSGPSVALGAMTNRPGSQRAKITQSGLSPLFGTNPADYKVSELQAEGGFFDPVTGTIRKTFRAALRIESETNPLQFYLSAGAGAVAKYNVVDITRPPGTIIPLQFSLVPNGNITLVDTRQNDVFTIGVSLDVNPTGGPPPVIEGAFWQGTYGSNFAIGLFDQPGIIRTSVDTGINRVLTIDGSTDFVVLVVNGMAFNIEPTFFASLGGPGSPPSSGNVYIDFGNTFDLNFGPAPGFESAQLILVPEPSLTVLMVVGVLVILWFGRARPRAAWRRMDTPLGPGTRNQ